ncbi:Rubrerythrin [Enhydrobacter aerosaccus]|uniref:Rubrerythrin n=1 Tax=Enhydrobacter aerosaccus TaxID=225324 RepID=A0A1T4SUY0_9HYPH|nr:ferritin family protein [Enhydrobacter aerosaccus]SKA31967.1 Rubrerythrin [Enhydrobacter aerosaccus]
MDRTYRATILRAEPNIKVESVNALMAIAVAMEEEAGRRYCQIGERMRLQGERSLFELFTFLAGIEDKHAAQIRERSQSIGGRLPEGVAVGWDLPEGFQEEEGRSYLLTPYSALAIAVRNEDRAFAFYAYLAAHAQDRGIREAAEELAKDELDHAALLRRERRKAWRTHPRAEAVEARDLGVFLAYVSAIESAAARAHRDLSKQLAQQGRQFEATIFEEAARSEEHCAREAVDRGALRPIAIFDTPSAETIRDGLRLLEYAFDQYAETAERTQDERVLAAAQDFQRQALQRLSYAQGALGGVSETKADRGER